MSDWRRFREWRERRYDELSRDMTDGRRIVPAADADMIIQVKVLAAWDQPDGVAAGAGAGEPYHA